MESKYIYVFATDIRTREDKEKIGKILDLINDIVQWSIDQEDIDCVLRIVSTAITEIEIAKIVQASNFECKPLE